MAVKRDEPKYNPVVWDVMFFAFKITARLLKELGVLSVLAAKAKESENEVDDKAVKIVEAAIDIMAE